MICLQTIEHTNTIMRNILNVNHIEWSSVDYVDLDTYENLDQLFADTVKIRLKEAEQEVTDNAIEERNKQNFIQLCNDLIDNKDLDEYRQNLEDVDRDRFEHFCCNDTVFCMEGKKDDYLIINMISMGNMETKYFFPYTSFRPSSVLRMDIPVICVAEDSTSKPYWFTPPNMVNGNGSVGRQELVDNITRLANQISKCKKVILLGDCRNVAGALSMANELEFVTHCLLLNGVTTMHPKHMQFPIETYEEINPWMVWTYIKGYELLKQVDEKHVDPFAHIRDGLDVHYWSAKYDEDFFAFRDHAAKYIDNVYELDYKFGQNVHYVMPHWDNKILPKFISDLIVKS